MFSPLLSILFVLIVVCYAESRILTREDLVSKYGNRLEILAEIQLSKNNLTNIHPSIFSGLVNLQKIDLSQNNLTNIDPSTFSGLVNIQEISLGQD